MLYVICVDAWFCVLYIVTLGFKNPRQFLADFAAKADATVAISLSITRLSPLILRVEQ